MRITTWNVNGIRNPFGYQPWRDQRTFNGMFDILEADIVIMQELKIQRKDLRDDMVLVPGWDCYFSLPKHKKGYSGVAIYTRQSVCAPIRAEEGIIGALCPPNSSTRYCDLPEYQQIGGYLTEEQISSIILASITDESKKIDVASLDSEGRCVILEFPAFVLFGVYSPANSSGMRDDFRYAFITALETRIRNLDAMGKRVILTGDLNVSRSEIETANADEDIRKMGISHEEYISTPNRRIFNQLVEGGPVAGARDPSREKPVLWDICREFHPDRKGMYTHWEQKINARPGNYGSRIDYILCSSGMKTWFCEGNIQEGLMGSDHCPVYAVFKDTIHINEQDIALLDIMNPIGTFKDGVRQQEYSTKEVPAFSGKLLPEFNKRRNIKDMFTRKPSLTAAKSTVDSDDGSLEAQPQSSADTTANITTPPSRTEQTGAQSVTGSRDLAEKAGKRQSPERKRSAPSSSAQQVVKRGKSNATSNPPIPPKNGQQSLRGFFKPKTVPDPTEPSSESNAAKRSATDISASITAAPENDTMHSVPILSSNTTGQTINGSDAGSNYAQPSNPSLHQELSSNTTTGTAMKESDDTVFDPIVSKESWSRLFTRPAAPRCESHQEPCMRLQSKKKGFNLGREFWMCARPIGPSGNKERGTQWRCTTFIWASDWQGPNDGNRGKDGAGGDMGLDT